MHLILWAGDASLYCAVLMWYLIVITSTEEDAAAGGVPLDQTHSSAVTVQLQHRLHHVAPQTALWDLPYSHLPCSQTHAEYKLI